MCCLPSVASNVLTACSPEITTLSAESPASSLQIFTEIEVSYYLLRRLLGVKTADGVLHAFAYAVLSKFRYCCRQSHSQSACLHCAGEPHALSRCTSVKLFASLLTRLSLQLLGRERNEHRRLYVAFRASASLRLVFSHVVFRREG
eukprot:6182063-Pleurochrysis_carterae.AAC.1